MAGLLDKLVEPGALYFVVEKSGVDAEGCEVRELFKHLEGSAALHGELLDVSEVGQAGVIEKVVTGDDAGLCARHELQDVDVFEALDALGVYSEAVADGGQHVQWRDHLDGLEVVVVAEQLHDGAVGPGQDASLGVPKVDGVCDAVDVVREAVVGVGLV